MPGYHTIIAAMAAEDKKMTEVLSTCSRGHVETFYRPGPVTALDMPMDNMSQRPGIRVMDYAGMLAIVSANGNQNYWIARCYANYRNHLDFYIRFGNLPGYVFYYELYVPDHPYLGKAMDENGLWADPSNWFCAYDRKLIECYTEEELAAIWGPIDGDETIAAPDDAMVGAAPIVVAEAADVAMDDAAIAVAESAATSIVAAAPIDDRATMEA